MLLAGIVFTNAPVVAEASDAEPPVSYGIPAKEPFVADSIMPVADELMEEIVSAYKQGTLLAKKGVVVFNDSRLITSDAKGKASEEAAVTFVYTVTDKVTLAKIAKEYGYTKAYAAEVKKEIFEFTITREALMDAAPAVYAAAPTVTPGPQPPASYNVRNVVTMGNQYYFPDEVKADYVYGGGTVSGSYVETTTSNWQFGLNINVKKIVEIKVGYTFGTSHTFTKSYSVTIPLYKNGRIEHWPIYTMKSFDIYNGNAFVKTGYTWKPTGITVKTTIF
ncbi:MAG: hypothetical protein LBQ91_00640 [Oscillospiraceae bacterium]|nr:hypothetical protein [Oscillospiraceae bacterium]